MLGVRISHQRQVANVRIHKHVKLEMRVLHSVSANNDTVKVLLTAVMRYYDSLCL